MYADLHRMLPQEFNNKERCLKWCKNKQLGIVHSLKLLSKEKECLSFRAPITNEVVDIYGDPEEIQWLHVELVKSNSYTYN